MKALFAEFISDEHGTTAVEYGVILVFVVLLVILLIKLFLEPQSKVAFNRVGDTVKGFGTIN